MCQLIESIKLLDGRFYNIEYHERRMENSLKELFHFHAEIHLQTMLKHQNYPAKGLFKCRIIYNNSSLDIEYVPYSPATLKSIKIVECNDIEYNHKFANRADIEKLLSMRNECDDVIITKNGLITDASYANIIFRAADGWYTPEKPLLKGTKRQELLDKGEIKEKEISLHDVTKYKSIKLINALRGLEQQEIDVSNIVF